MELKQNTTFAQRVSAFYGNLSLDVELPEGIVLLNPYKDPRVLETTAIFYNKFFNDKAERRLILGINPGRLGAGSTGVPFTDSKRLIEDCGIPFDGKLMHEPSSAFIYELIDAWGGPEMFYSRFFIGSVCPLGFVTRSLEGKEKNINYYDNKRLLLSVTSFIKNSICQQIMLGCSRKICYCLGTGENYRYLSQLNAREKYFERIIPLEHPRFIMQYKSKKKADYISHYISQLDCV